MELSALQKQVLQTLLDRLEQRRDYGLAEKSTRRILLAVNKKNFPDYFHVSDSSFRLMFNQEMVSLERRGFVALDWIRFDRGQTLQRIALVVRALPEIYSILKRVPREQLYRETAALMEEWEKEAPAALFPLFREIKIRLASLQPLPAPLKVEKPLLLQDLLKGVQTLLTPRENDLAKRVLSTRIYGDSKRWEQLERSILQLARSFCLSPQEAELDDTALLAELGIIEHPSHLLIAGPLVFSTPQGKIDLGAFYPDLGLPAEMIPDLEILESEAQAVITIENKTSFYQYLREGPAGHLVIYLGGYHNRARRRLLEILAAYFSKEKRTIHFYHWGDLDLGGFQIWHHLGAKTGISFEPFLMDIQTYLRYCHRGQPLGESYLNKLAALLEKPDYKIFHPLIVLMLEKKIRIEQEAVSIQNLRAPV